MNEFAQKDVWELEWVHKVEDFDENFEDNLDFVTVERNKLFFYTNSCFTFYSLKTSEVKEILLQ